METTVAVNGLFYPAISASDSDFGPWLGGGVYWPLGERFDLGVDVRYNKAEIRIGGADLKASGLHLGILLGCRL